MFRALSMIRRLSRAAKVLGAHGVLPPPEWAELAPPQLKLLSILFRKSKAEMHGRTGERLSRALTKLGPSYIKAGQFLATRPDVIGAEIARDLSELQDRMRSAKRAAFCRNSSTRNTWHRSVRSARPSPPHRLPKYTKSRCGRTKNTRRRDILH